MNRRFYCDARTEVETVEGRVRGCFVNDLYYFRGIPYATAERYRMPKPMDHWDGVKEAVTYGPVAPTVRKPGVKGSYSLSSQPLFGYRFWPEDEQCQYINVWTKNPDPSRKRPVLVWVHGGGFDTGSSVEQMSYDGANFCRDGDLVVVSFNHRLNILGYLDMSEFGEEYWNSGNAGMADIVEALKWVQRNIERFGGDPSNVTLFGQSGGGGKIRTLLSMPAADGLYTRVIFQSGLMNIAGEVEDSAVRRKLAAKMVENLGLTKETFEEIRKVPFEKLREAYLAAEEELAKQGLRTTPALGPVKNEYYLGNVMDVGFTEHAKTIPVLAGSVQCEAALGRVWHPYDLPAEEKDKLLSDYFGEYKDELIELFEKAYPGSDLMDLYYMDFETRIDTTEFLDAKEKFGAPAYNYLITYHLNYFGGMPSYHGFCLPLVFGNTEYVDACNEPDCVALSQKMHQAWINFATCGDPNGGDVPKWEPYKSGKGGTMICDKKCEMRYKFDDELVRLMKKAGDYPNAFMAFMRAKAK